MAFAVRVEDHDWEPGTWYRTKYHALEDYLCPREEPNVSFGSPGLGNNINHAMPVLPDQYNEIVRSIKVPSFRREQQPGPAISGPCGLATRRVLQVYALDRRYRFNMQTGAVEEV